VPRNISLLLNVLTIFEAYLASYAMVIPGDKAAGASAEVKNGRVITPLLIRLHFLVLIQLNRGIIVPCKTCLAVRILLSSIRTYLLAESQKT
jgi:hypothetical protein